MQDLHDGPCVNGWRRSLARRLDNLISRFGTLFSPAFEHRPDQIRGSFRFLGNLPPDRKKQFETRLGRYERMTPEQRQRVREQYELFQGLPKERQEALRRTFRNFSELPPRRRPPPASRNPARP